MNCVIVSPGDVVVVQSDQPMTLQQKDSIRNDMLRAFPANRCVILDPQYKLDIVGVKK